MLKLWNLNIVIWLTSSSWSKVKRKLLSMAIKTMILSLLDEMAPNMSASLRRLCSKGYIFKTTQHVPACDKTTAFLMVNQQDKCISGLDYILLHTYHFFGNVMNRNLIIRRNILLLLQKRQMHLVYCWRNSTYIKCEWYMMCTVPVSPIKSACSRHQWWAAQICQSTASSL